MQGVICRSEMLTVSAVKRPLASRPSTKAFTTVMVVLSARCGLPFRTRIFCGRDSEHTDVPPPHGTLADGILRAAAILRYFS